MGRENAQNEFLLYFLSEECVSPSWSSWHKTTANLYGFWEFLVLEEVCVLFEEQWISGGVVMQLQQEKFLPL